MANQTKYNFLPFRFKNRKDHYLLVNETGEYIFLDKNDFKKFSQKQIEPNSELFLNLKSKFFLFTDSLPRIIETLATKYRTKNRFLYDYTSLHMFVVTYRCNQSCTYCHASSQNEVSSSDFDMDKMTAINSVEFVFNSPSQNIKIEFQGGEPLLNFDIIKTIVEHAEKINGKYQKNIEFILCTNLTNLTNEQLQYIKEKNIIISTSLDGPEEIHNKCRKYRNGKGTYHDVVEKINWVKSELGNNMVSTLMTVTPFNIRRLKEVIDEYLEQCMEYIFIRKLNPFGYALKNISLLDYSLTEFISGYKEALEYIFEINRSGQFFPEVFATILSSRILTPFSTGFVDLQSPTGGAISGVIYDVNGDIFISDEARMMYRTTMDKKFCIGNVNSNTWKEAYLNNNLKSIINDSCIDAIPGCAWCVYKTYCGSDPVRNYFTQKNMIGYRPTNDFCLKHKKIFDMLFSYLKNDSDDVDEILWSWITNRSLNQIKNYDFDIKEKTE